MHDPTTARRSAEQTILAVAPGRADDLARLDVLAHADDVPVITVIGKYNHGKSSLLNALAGDDVFAVADRRETTTLSAHEAAGVRWLDAPGLDADVASADDRAALHAAWQAADIRLLVHAAREGELDAAERTLLRQLREDDARTRRQTLFVLSQVDQVGDEQTLSRVTGALQAQAPELPLHSASSMRHRKGMEGGKSLMIAKSGIPGLRQALDDACARVGDARRHETTLRLEEIREELEQTATARDAALSTIRSRQSDARDDFLAGLDAVLANAGEEIHAALDVPGTEDAMRPDTSAEFYLMTAGKLERARQQLAYAKVNRAIAGYLAGHGVEHLPTRPDSPPRSINTVMVAVLGISVKFRDDLKRMFCEPAGRARLQARFAHYYELSDDRVALAGDVARARDAVAEGAQALSAWQTLAAAA